jgi:hypothetical protein
VAIHAARNEVLRLFFDVGKACTLTNIQMKFNEAIGILGLLEPHVNIKIV